jgi:hypothetical protein
VNCATMEPLLARIAASEAAPRLALEAARHLAHCRSCAAALLRMRQLSGMLDSLPQVDPAPGFARRVLNAVQKKARGAAGAILLVLLPAAAGGLIVFSGGGIPGQTSTPTTSVGAPFAAVFAVARTLSGLVMSALDALRAVPLMVPGLHLPPASVAVLIVFAAITAAGSAAALGAALVQVRRGSGDAQLRS